MKKELEKYVNEIIALDEELRLALSEQRMDDYYRLSAAIGVRAAMMATAARLP